MKKTHQKHIDSPGGDEFASFFIRQEFDGFPVYVFDLPFFGKMFIHSV